MLRELRIRDFAVIDELHLELRPGLNALTGETGAGKSIIVGALSLLLGERASAEDVRAGEDEAVVEAAFDVQGREAVLERCREAGVAADGGWLVLRRRVRREGRNRAWINDSPATAGLVWELGSALVELHGQHEHQRLTRPAAQRRILDAYAGAGEEAGAVRELHGELEEVRDEIDEVRRRAREARERADYLEFKAAEIEDADLEPGEEERLRAEARRLENSEELMALAGALHEAVYAGDRAVIDRLGELGRKLDELVELDPGAEELREMFGSARAELEELGRRLGSYRDGVDHDPARLDRIRSRLDEIFRLKQKYGRTVEEVVEAGREARRELQALEGSEARVEELEAREADLEERLDAAAGVLSRARREAAGRLEDEIGPLLGELGMEGGRFEVELEPRTPPGPHGAESVEFRVSLNPGFDPAPLSRVASGGELSRVMLALEAVLARVDDVPSLVFDEIDAGVGGRVAHQVAEKLAAVSDDHQVFVVTHLPQIAARADAHFRVEKRPVEGRAAAGVEALEGDERVSELARMLGGDPDSQVSRDHAQELMQASTAR
ncbi:MAG: DNA repair protein RecN [Gemmatimonadota bacterium]